MARSGNTPSKREKIYERDDYSCVYCYSKDNLTLDHIVPINWNNTKRNYGIPRTDLIYKKYIVNGESNIVTSCLKCNNKKGSKSLKVFFQFRPELKKTFMERTRNFVDKRILETILASA